MRTAEKERQTKETKVRVSINLDGLGQATIATGIPFFDHMLHLLAVHSLWDLQVQAQGDLAVDYHHTIEDVGLVLGDALNEALGERKGINRYGWAAVPMDEALAQVTVDFGGRPYLVYQMACRSGRVRDFDIALFEEFFRSFCVRARLNLHISQPYGTDPHHAAEAVFKAVARALRMAGAADERMAGVPSSKGII